MTSAVQSRTEQRAVASQPRRPERSPARFRGEGLLATTAAGEDRPPRSIVGASVVLHLVVLTTLLVLATQVRQAEQPERIDVVFVPRAAETLPPAPPVRMREPDPELRPRPPEPPIEIARPIETSPPVHRPPPPVRRPPPSARPAPRLEPVASVAPPAVTPRPAPVRPSVRTELFERAPAKPVAHQPAKPETRTGAFATPDPPVARQRPQPRALGTARIGSFEVAATPAEPAEPEAEERPVVAKASFGDPPVVAAAPSTGRAEPRSVTTVGFGSTAASTAPPAAGTGSVRAGTFGEVVEETRPRPSPKKPAANPETPVEILSKPKPVYTTEARELKIEGEVVLEVTFVASGQLRVLGVVESLGHGLDEAAVEAATKIHFTPAKRNGRPIDYTAVLRIVFQLV